jgi:hypothetical protein
MALSPSKKGVPILIYASGLGQHAPNTADGVADVIAAVLDRRAKGTYTSSADPTVTAPRGLRVGKTVMDDKGAAVLHVFELDYKIRLDVAPSPAGPPASPGAIRASTYAVTGALWLIWAWRRGAKSRMAKVQLGFALLAVFALVLAAIVTIAALVTAAVGNSPPKWMLWLGGVGIGTWAALRKRLLAIAATTQQTIRYVGNEGRRGDTVAMTVDDALDGLRDNGWEGDVHLLGYSFGSLVLIDALFPKSTSLRDADLAKPVLSLTTIGCPFDAVRLFRPEYFSTSRNARMKNLDWYNVFNAADVFGSNLIDKDDKGTKAPPRTANPAPRGTDGTAQDGESGTEGHRSNRPGRRIWHRGRREGTEATGAKVAVDICGTKPSSTRYLEETLGPLQVLRIKGFTTHGGYWGAATDANCFEVLVDHWVPLAENTAPGA